MATSSVQIHNNYYSHQAQPQTAGPRRLGCKGLCDYI